MKDKIVKIILTIIYFGLIEVIGIKNLLMKFMKFYLINLLNNY